MPNSFTKWNQEQNTGLADREVAVTRDHPELPTALLQEMRQQYAGLLAATVTSSKDAWSALEAPLCQLWMSAYKRGCSYDPFLELLTDRVAVFLHDSSAYEGVGPVNRVVAAASVSRERLPLRDLLERRRREWQTGESSAETRSLLRQAFIALSEGLSRENLEALNQAAARILGWDLRPIPWLLERWVAEYEAASSPKRRAMLRRRAMLVLTSGASSFEGQSTARRPKAAEKDGVEGLRTLAAEATSGLSPESRRLLAGKLAGLVADARRELEKRIADTPTEDLFAGIEEHLLPLDFVHRPQPRYAGGARYRRRGLQWTTDLGHFIPHTAGGPADINLFHQDRRLNRGWSSQGRAYRSMERFIAEHPGTFHFTRAVYEDESETPRYLEIGMLVPLEQARRLEQALGTYAGFHLCLPPIAKEGHLAWAIGVFDNRPQGA